MVAILRLTVVVLMAEQLPLVQICPVVLATHYPMDAALMVTHQPGRRI